MRPHEGELYVLAENQARAGMWQRRLKAYCLSITLSQQVRGVNRVLMPRTVSENLATIQMLDVLVPTLDGPKLLLTRYTDPEVTLLLEHLELTPCPLRRNSPPGQLTTHVVPTFAAPAQ